MQICRARVELAQGLTKMNAKTLICIGSIIFYGCFAGSLAADSSDADSENPRPLVFVITGESNSGGNGDNSAASPKERELRACVQIMNLTSGKFGFENMQLGVNNLRDHFRMTEFHYANWHGFENELANSVEANTFPGHKQVYLIKTGHGGSRIAEWEQEHPSGYWKKFIQRINAGKRQLPENHQWVVWFSLGINDAIAKTPVDQWKKGLGAHLKRMKKQLPGAIIVMTQFQSMRNYPEIDTALAEIAAREANVFVVDSTGAALKNSNHWSYAGLKTVTQRMVKITRQAVNETRKGAAGVSKTGSK